MSDGGRARASRSIGEVRCWLLLFLRLCSRFCLLMAHQNESKTSDMGSSLREDPYGASLLFDSYGRAGYQVKRGQDEDSLSDQDASRTTAFFIGGYSITIGQRTVEICRMEQSFAGGWKISLHAAAASFWSNPVGN